jgi:hypothetical protein
VSLHVQPVFEGNTAVYLVLARDPGASIVEKGKEGNSKEQGK